MRKIIGENPLNTKVRKFTASAMKTATFILEIKLLLKSFNCTLHLPNNKQKLSKNIEKITLHQLLSRKFTSRHSLSQFLFCSNYTTWKAEKFIYNFKFLSKLLFIVGIAAANIKCIKYSKSSRKRRRAELMLSFQGVIVVFG